VTVNDLLTRDPKSTYVIYRRKENFTWFPLLKNLINNQTLGSQLGFSVSNTRKRGMDMKKA
jgi:hypothetical protein